MGDISSGGDIPVVHAAAGDDGYSSQPGVQLDRGYSHLVGRVRVLVAQALERLRQRTARAAARRVALDHDKILEQVVKIESALNRSGYSSRRTAELEAAAGWLQRLERENERRHVELLRRHAELSRVLERENERRHAELLRVLEMVSNQRSAPAAGIRDT